MEKPILIFASVGLIARSLRKAEQSHHGAAGDPWTSSRASRASSVERREAIEASGV
jgi:hypothetical protein